METTLTPTEIRILGCLIEKQLTTPDYYPLTLNALTNACNQKSNREPVVHFEETDTTRGIDGLRHKGYAQLIESAGSRIPKYRHLLPKAHDLMREEVAILCELFLRGPQTVGELKNRASRMFEFTDMQQVETLLQGLADSEKPLVIKLPRRPGHKESRYMHLFCGMPDIEAEEAGDITPEAATLAFRAENERITQLEHEVGVLQQTVATLQQQFDEFRKQFE